MSVGTVTAMKEVPYKLGLPLRKDRNANFFFPMKYTVFRHWYISLLTFL